MRVARSRLEHSAQLPGPAFSPSDTTNYSVMAVRSTRIRPADHLAKATETVLLRPKTWRFSRRRRHGSLGSPATLVASSCSTTSRPLTAPALAIACRCAYQRQMRNLSVGTGLLRTLVFSPFSAFLHSHQLSAKEPARCNRTIPYGFHSCRPRPQSPEGGVHHTYLSVARLFVECFLRKFYTIAPLSGNHVLNYSGVRRGGYLTNGSAALT